MADTEPQQSSLKQFLASIATIRGDLSNITAPPFVLADKSTTEFPRFWIEHPDIFCAPAKEQDPARRILLVLKWFLSSLKAQQYAGRNPSDGVKKPLNAFLGEIFTGECGPEDDPTKLLSEQVSHHPPVTACYLWNDKHGIRAEGYTRQEISFSGGSVAIQQIGHAVLHIDAFDEDYLIPLPNVRIKGILTGGPYPELHGSYHIVSSSGFVAEVDFSGKSMLGLSGSKQHVHAAIYKLDDHKRKDALFSAEGTWSDTFVLKDSSGKDLETYDVAAVPPTQFRTLPLDKQDPWESRKAWAGVIQGVHAGDMHAVAERKSELENAQREMRKRDATSEAKWAALFFRREASNSVAEKLLGLVGEKHDAKSTCGIWRVDGEKLKELKRPWRGESTPFG